MLQSRVAGALFAAQRFYQFLTHTGNRDARPFPLGDSTRCTQPIVDIQWNFSVIIVTLSSLVW
jgi:hypothetical protein